MTTTKKDIGLQLTMFVFTLFMGAGTTLFSSDSPFSNIPGFLIFMMLLIYMARKIKHYTNHKQIITILLFVFIWLIYHWTRVGHYDFAFVMLELHIIAGYMMICLYKEKIIDYYEDIAYKLALIAIPLWIINNLIGSEMMTMFAPFDSSALNNAHEENGSFLVYITGAWQQEQFGELYRNQGYCWEAGRFASLTVLGLTFYIIKNSGVPKFLDRRMWVYIIAILSTFSTTGYIAMLIVFSVSIIFAGKKNLFSRILIGGMLIVAVVYLQNADFIGEKITEQLDSSSFKSEGATYNAETGVITVERFEGVYLDWLNFVDAPVMGYGLTDMWSYTQRNINKELITSNGITKPFAQYGFILALMYFIYFIRGSRRITAAHGNAPKLLLFVALILISFSYDFNKLPLILAIALYSIMQPYTENKNERKSS